MLDCILSLWEHIHLVDDIFSGFCHFRVLALSQNSKYSNKRMFASFYISTLYLERLMSRQFSFSCFFSRRNSNCSRLASHVFGGVFSD